MSASSELKEQILERPEKNPCCRRALLHGAMFAKAELRDGQIRLRLASRGIADFLAQIVSEVYGKGVGILPPERGGRGCVLAFHSPSAARRLSETKDAPPYKAECPACEGAFLRGVFLASGRLTDPDKQYCLEFSAEGREEALSAFFSLLGLLPRGIRRRGCERVLYFRNSAEIETFFTLADLNAITFRIINKKIERSLRSEANRARNFETFNIRKSTSASAEQVAVLRRLQDAGLLGNLPDELESTARFRLENDSLSLSQLAALMTPKISKSGLSHRLAKIIRIAKELLGNV